MEVWANSGSSRWSVEPVFEALGVAAEKVIGIELESAGGVVTSREVLPIPIREGKVDAMRARSIPSVPGLPTRSWTGTSARSTTGRSSSPVRTS
jgi:hypothetical protein